MSDATLAAGDRVMVLSGFNGDPTLDGEVVGFAGNGAFVKVKRETGFTDWYAAERIVPLHSDWASALAKKRKQKDREEWGCVVAGVYSIAATVVIGFALFALLHQIQSLTIRVDGLEQTVLHTSETSKQ